MVGHSITMEEMGSDESIGDPGGIVEAGERLEVERRLLRVWIELFGEEALSKWADLPREELLAQLWGEMAKYMKGNLDHIRVRLATAERDGGTAAQISEARQLIAWLETPPVKERFKSLGIEPMPMTVGEFGKFYRDDIAANVALVKAAKIPTQ